MATTTTTATVVVIHFVLETYQDACEAMWSFTFAKWTWQLFRVWLFFVSIWANIEFGTVHMTDNILCGGVSLPISYVAHQQVDLISNSMSLLFLFRPCVVLLSVCSGFWIFSHTTLFSFARIFASFRCELFTGQLRYGLSRRIYFVSTNFVEQTFVSRWLVFFFFVVFVLFPSILFGQMLLLPPNGKNSFSSSFSRLSITEIV